MHTYTSRTVNTLRKSALWFYVAVIAGAGIAPVFLLNSASAATVQLTNREARVTNAIPNTTFDITFEFDTPSNASEPVQGIELEFADDPLAEYASAPSNTPDVSSAAYGSITNWDQNSTAFTLGATEDGDSFTGAGGSSLNQLVLTRTEPGPEDVGSTDKTLQITGLTHNVSTNTTFYVKIRLYSDTARTAANLVWEGVVAQSTSQTLNVSARVQERLEFCVGTTTTNDAVTLPVTAAAANINSCTDMDGTNVDLGVVDNSQISHTPVLSINGGNQTNGIAMVNTNAVNGTVISYAAIQESSSGQLKVDGATCAGPTILTDQCFNSSGATQGPLTAGTEEFGMTIAGVNCGSVNPISYTCNYAGGTNNLQQLTNYVGGANTTTYGGASTANFAWVDDGSYTNIASSSGSAVRVIDDEALILRFAATAGATTPTGTYDVDVDYVATPTF